MRLRRLVWLMVALVLAAGSVAAVSMAEEDYELRILMPSAAGVFVGAKTVINGHQVGEVTGIGVQDDKARVTVAIDDEFAPVPAGTTARISWRSLVGVRVVELVLPEKVDNPALPSGKLITSDTERVELDDVLAALDPKTRARLQSVVTHLRQTLEGRETDVKATVTSAGPTVHALGEVLRAVGQDGPAIRQLVAKLRRMVTTLSERDTELGGTVHNLGRLVGSTAQQQKQLKATLDELPSTVRQGSELFDRVPAAVDATVPLLRELRPATRELPEVARNLGPVLSELRPTVHALRPTLGAARSLLASTPELLDTAQQTLPGARNAVDQVQPATRFLRPYTPELIGFIGNWTSLFSGKNPSGHFGRALIVESASAVTDNPGVVPPGMNQDPEPAPGSLAGQSWTDANGDGIR